MLWDMDGTIIDSEPLWLSAELALLERYGLALTPEVRDQLIGSGLWDAAELFRELGVPLSADEIVAEWVQHVGAGMREHAPHWRPGARELLESLRVAGIPSALVTMSVRSLAEHMVELLPPGTFNTIIAGDEVDHAKPHPQPYLLGAAALGVPIEQCLVFEDSPTGLASAVASGAVSVGIPNLISLRGTSAHALWSSLRGLDADAVRAQFGAMRDGDPHPQDHVIEVIGALA